MIPVYLRILGPVQWGIVSVCLTLQGFMTLIDAGLGQIMPRDIARASHDSNSLTKTFLLFSRAYGGLAVIGFGLGQLVVPFLAKGWLQRPAGTTLELVWALRLVLVLFLFQFANNAHTGLFNGTQQQKLANILQCVFATLRHGLALLLLLSWQPTALAYILGFAPVAALEWVSNRYVVQKRLLAVDKVKVFIGFGDYRQLAREVGIMAAAILLGMLVFQSDRIVLSRMLDLSRFGHYVVVANLGANFLQLQYPLQRAFLPHIASQLHDNRRAYIRLALSLGLLCAVPCLLVIMTSHWLLQAWTGNVRLADEGAMALRLILTAVAVNCGYGVIYQKMLTQQAGQVILFINLATLLIAFPLLYFMAPFMGVTAGGMMWLTTSGVQLCLGVLWYQHAKQTRRSDRS